MATSRWPPLLLTLATLLALGRVCTFGFTNVEDEGLITTNPNLNPPTLAGLRNHWAEPHIGLYIPVTYSAWWVLARLGQTSTPDEFGATLNPWLFHGANLALHLAASLFVLALLRRLRLRDGPALIGAMLFALHPVQVEAVAWTTGMKDVLCGALAMAALYAYLVALQPNVDDRAGGGANLAGETAKRCGPPLRAGVYVVATICFALAMLAKPAAVVLPVMAAAIDVLLLKRPWRRVVATVLPWLALAVPVLVVTRLVQPAADVASSPLWARPLIAADALAFYLWKLVWPFNLTMAYSRSPHAVTHSGAIRWTWLVPAGVAVLVAVARRRWLVAAALLFVAGLLPVLGLTKFTFQQFSTVADRYLYLSMLGVALAVAHVAARHWSNRLVRAACAVALVLLGARSFAQAGTWSNALTLYRHAVRAAPESSLAHGNLSAVLLEAGRAAEAAPHAARAVQLAPHRPILRVNYALILDALGRYAEEAEQLDALMRLHPSPGTARRLEEVRAKMAAKVTE
ncbi:MAG TPA: hypothetical protein VER17_05420 [Tepidisphaeraceae bacterium]|nr:hypothetical protein [Tepidisphaeraceae bacterium]